MVADVSVCVCELQLLSDELLKISSLSRLYLAGRITDVVAAMVALGAPPSKQLL